MLTSRRSFLGLLAAPAIIRASSLMKIVPLPEPEFPLWAAINSGDRVITGMAVGEWPGVEFKIVGWKEYMGCVDNIRFAHLYAQAEDDLLRAALG